MDLEYKLCKSFDMIIEMLNDRNIKTDLHSGQIQSFLKDQTHKTGFQICLNNEYRIVYQLSQKPLWRELNKLLLDIDQNTCKHTIIVLLEKLSNKDTLKLETEHKDIDKQVFLLRELQFNPTKHHLVPKHEVIRDKNEIKKIMSDLSLNHLSQLPLILKTDPIARWLYAKPGDILRISRPSETAGKYITYRHCV